MTGKPLPHINDPDAILKSIENEVWAYVAINTIGKSLSSTPLIVKSLQSVNAKAEWVEVEKHPLLDLVKRPNAFEPIDQLIWRLVMSLMTGDAYLLHPRGEEALYYAHPDIVKVVPSGDGISHYEVGRYPNKVNMEVDEVIHFRMPNPYHEFYGLSPLSPVKQHVLINYYYSRHLKGFFKNGAVPLGALQTEQALGEETIGRMRQEWEKVHQGAENSNRVAILSNGLKYENISPPLQELAVDMLYKMPREAILASFGIPPIYAGVFEYANYANSQEQIKMFWESTVIPKQRIISGYLNSQLVYPKYGDKVKFDFDNSAVAALQEDEQIKSTKLRNYVSGGIMTPNEARGELGLEPVDGGDELRSGGFGSLFDDVSGDNSDNADDADKSVYIFRIKKDGEELGIGKEQPSPSQSLSVRDDSPRLTYLAAHIKKIKHTEYRFAILMKRYFDKQLDRILTNIEKISIDGELLSALLYREIKGVDDDADGIFSKAVENQILYETFDGFITNVIKEAGESALNSINVDMQFNVNNPKVQGAIQSFHNRLSKVNDSTYDEIKNILQQVYDDGGGLNQAEKLLREKYSWMSKTRAKTIAATEMNGMVNTGSLIAHKEAGVPKKEWLTAPGSEHPRHELYAGLDGQIVNIDEPFDVGGEMLMVPGDPSGSPGNVCNCKCAYAPVIDD